MARCYHYGEYSGAPGYPAIHDISFMTTKSAVEIAIRELVQQWMQATRDGDLETVLRLIADDVVFMVPGREPCGKEEFAVANGAMKGVQIEGESDIQEIQVIGDWAWMRNKLRVTVTPPAGKPMVRAGYTLTILRREADGRWVIARDANLLAPAE